MIKKRDGSLVDFDINRVIQAVFKAFKQTGKDPGDYPLSIGYVRGDVNYKLLHMLNYGNIIPNNMPTLGIGNSNYRWWNREAPLASDSGIVYSQMYNFNMNVNVFPLAAYRDWETRGACRFHQR